MMVRRRAPALALLVCGFLVLSASGAEATIRVLGLYAYSQAKSNWCWVAASKSVITYLTSNDPTQCTIYKRGKSVSSCAGNETGSFYGDVERALSQSGVSDVGYAINTSVSYGTLVDNIDRRAPMLARLAWKSSDKKTAHMAPIRGYDNDGNNTNVYWIYIENAPTSSDYRKNSYSLLRDNASWPWSHTRYSIDG